MGKKKYTKKQCRKLFDKKCFFCGIDDYDLLDAHRIVEGQNGGTYHWVNMLTCCSLCHRKIHSGRIHLLGNHPGLAGWYIHYVDEDGEEKWILH